MDGPSRAATLRAIARGYELHPIDNLALREIADFLDERETKAGAREARAAALIEQQARALAEAQRETSEEIAQFVEQWMFPIAEDGSHERVGKSLAKAIRLLAKSKERS